MTESHEAAMVTLLAAWSALVALVSDRITWDSEEIDLEYPSITLRSLAGVPSARDLGSRGGLRRCLIEIAAHTTTSTQCSQVLDHVVDALTPYESGPFEVGSARFGVIHLDDVTQTLPPRERSYRKAARYVVHIYE
jgi:hypothetical protein